MTFFYYFLYLLIYSPILQILTLENFQLITQFTLLILLNIFFIYKIFDYLINKINLSFDKLINYFYNSIYIYFS